MLLSQCAQFLCYAAGLLGFVNHPAKGESNYSQNTSKHALLHLIEDHPMVEFSIIYCIVIS